MNQLLEINFDAIGEFIHDNYRKINTNMTFWGRLELISEITQLFNHINKNDDKITDIDPDDLLVLGEICHRKQYTQDDKIKIIKILKNNYGYVMWHTFENLSITLGVRNGS